MNDSSDKTITTFRRIFASSREALLQESGEEPTCEETLQRTIRALEYVRLCADAEVAGNLAPGDDDMLLLAQAEVLAFKKMLEPATAELLDLVSRL